MSEVPLNPIHEAPPTTEPPSSARPVAATQRRIDVPAPFRPFPLEVLPNAVREFVSTCADAIGCDASMVILPTFSVLASAIGNSHRIQLKRGWSEPSCIWTAVVIDSGKSKSPAFDQPLSPIHDRQEKLFEKYDREMREHNEKIDQLKHAKREKRRVKSGESKTSADELSPPVPTCERLVCNDVTIEALADRLSSTPRGLLVARDELSGFLCSFDQYKTGKGSDVALWLELHRGGVLTVDRKASERKVIRVPRALVSITGGIQPQVLTNVLGKEYFANGLAARFLLVMPPFRQKVWNENEITDDVREAFDTIVGGLLDLELAVAPDERRIPNIVVMSPAAKSCWVEFYNKHGAVQADVEGDLAAAFSKLEGYAARLALIFHLVGHVSGDPTCAERLVCSKESMERGIAAAGWFCEETERIYAILNESEETREIRTLVELIERKGGTTTVRALQHGSRKYPNAKLAEAALERLVIDGLGRWRERATTDDGGRPTRDFVLNPPETRRQNRQNPGPDPEGSEGFVGCVGTSGDVQTRIDGNAGEEIRI